MEIKTKKEFVNLFLNDLYNSKQKKKLEHIFSSFSRRLIIVERLENGKLRISKNFSKFSFYSEFEFHSFNFKDFFKEEIFDFVKFNSGFIFKTNYRGYVLFEDNSHSFYHGPKYFIHFSFNKNIIKLISIAEIQTELKKNSKEFFYFSNRYFFIENDFLWFKKGFLIKDDSILNISLKSPDAILKESISFVNISCDLNLELQPSVKYDLEHGKEYLHKLLTDLKNSL